MNKSEREIFFGEMVESIKDIIEEVSPKIPSDWTGVECRALLCDLIEERMLFDMTRSGRRKYQNDRMTAGI